MLGIPTSNSDAVTKQYVDDLASDSNAPIGSPEWEAAVDNHPKKSAWEPDEPGVGNSRVSFDEQIRAMPPELRGTAPTFEAATPETQGPLYEVLEPTFREPEPERELITLSSLRDVRPDPDTYTGSPTDNGALTPQARPDIFPRT